MEFCTTMRFFSRVRRFTRGRRRPPDEPRRYVFLYHRVASPDHDPFQLAVPREWFQAHLEILGECCRLTSLADLLRGETTGARPLAAITFDDGYVDNLRTAAPILREAAIPATFFICTSALGDSRGFWWDRVAGAIAGGSARLSKLESMSGLLPAAHISLAEDLTRATLDIASRLQRLRPGPRNRLVEEIEDVLLSGSSQTSAPCPVLDEAAVRELGLQPFTELGAHTHNHPMLSTLSGEEQLSEISLSVAQLHAISGTRPRFLAYPYGGGQDYNVDSCLAARDAGLEAAFVNHAGSFDPISSPYRVPRYYVPPLPADQFRAWLSRIIRA